MADDEVEEALTRLGEEADTDRRRWVGTFTPEDWEAEERRR
jgi:hypothetical protein